MAWGRYRYEENDAASATESQCLGLHNFPSLGSIQDLESSLYDARRQRMAVEEYCRRQRQHSGVYGSASARDRDGDPASTRQRTNPQTNSRAKAGLISPSNEGPQRIGTNHRAGYYPSKPGKVDCATSPAHRSRVLGVGSYLVDTGVQTVPQDHVSVGSKARVRTPQAPSPTESLRVDQIKGMVSSLLGELCVYPGAATNNLRKLMGQVVDDLSATRHLNEHKDRVIASLQAELAAANNRSSFLQDRHNSHHALASRVRATSPLADARGRIPALARSYRTTTPPPYNRAQLSFIQDATPGPPPDSFSDDGD
ncbi:hypothetical protein DIPPA_29409 [Diplonema papillatum]|nr:hypothetical protein DIPPA_29409 [Diplonema papillatum]